MAYIATGEMRMMLLRKCFFATLFVALSACAWCAFSAGTASAGEEDTFDSGIMDSVWSKRTEELAIQQQDAKAAAQGLKSGADEMNRNVSAVQDALRNLMTLYQLSRGHPTELLNIAQRLRVLQTRLDAQMSVVRAISARTRTHIEDLTALRANFSAQEVAADQSVAISDYIGALNQTITLLQQTLNTAERLAVPGESLATRLGQTLEQIEGELPSIWRDFYFTDAGRPFSLTLWQTLPVALAEWAASTPARMGFAYPQKLDNWLAVGGRLLLVGVPLLALGLWLGRMARRLPPRWASACQGIRRGPWSWITLGCALIAASASTNGGYYLLFGVAGVLILIWGILSLAWRLRVASKPDAPQRSPIVPLFLPTVLGILFLYTDLPPQLLGAVWILIMIVLMAISGRKKQTTGEGQPNKAPTRGRAFSRLTMLICAISILCTLVGYTRMAIPVFMAFFALSVFFELGGTLVSLMSLLADTFWNKRTEPWRNGVFHILLKPVAWIAAMLCLLPWLWALPGAGYLISYAGSIERSVGKASFSFSRIVWIVVIFFITRLIASLVHIALKHLPDRFPAMERGVIPPVQTLTRYAIWAIFFVIALTLLGVNLTSLAVVAGGLSVGVGLGMQNLFSNLVSGLMLLFGRTILVGDLVQVGDTWGIVKKVSTRFTELETGDHSVIHLPNSELLNNRLVNWTRNDRLIRKDITVGVAYGSDVALVMRTLAEIAAAHPRVLKNPPPDVVFSDFAASSLDFTLRVHIDDVDNSLATCTDLRVAIDRLFREKGIDIAFPQLDVHLSNAAEPGAAQSAAQAGGA